MTLAFSITLGVEPIRLVTDDALGAADPAAPWPQWLLQAGALGAVVLPLLVLTVLITRRLTRDRDPEERAFRAMARRLRLRDAHRATLRDLAARVDAPPIALILCHSAFTRAIGLSDADTAPPDRARHLDLEHRIFG